MKSIKQLLFALVFMVLFSELAHAQKFPGLDTSPADIAYLRQDGKRSTPIIKVSYGRPQKKGRTMLGETEAYGKVWRTGANETTEIKFFKDVTFGDQQIKAGQYSLYTIPGKDEWTIILNSKLDTWGAYEYDETKDVVRFKVPAGKPDSEIEAFTIFFEGEKGTGTMLLAWENTLIKIPVKF